MDEYREKYTPPKDYRFQAISEPQHDRLTRGKIFLISIPKTNYVA